MAAIGMKYPTFAAISAEAEQGAITYTGGKIFAHAISGTLTENRRDNPLYGDDAKQENDKGMTDYSLTIEVDHLDIADRVTLLGETAVTGTGSTVTHYMVRDVNPGYVGFGFIRVLMVDNTYKYEGYWFHKMQFTEPTIQANTKKDQVEWGTNTLEGTGFGVELDSTNGIQFYDHMEFTTEAAAKTWLKGRAGIST